MQKGRTQQGLRIYCCYCRRRRGQGLYLYLCVDLRYEFVTWSSNERTRVLVSKPTLFILSHNNLCTRLSHKYSSMSHRTWPYLFVAQSYSVLLVHRGIDQEQLIGTSWSWSVGFWQICKHNHYIVVACIYTDNDVTRQMRRRGCGWTCIRFSCKST